MPSLVQRFGRAARDRKLQGVGVLYAPPISKTSPSDKNVREFLSNQTAGSCLWTLIDKLFEVDGRTCDKNCSRCFEVKRPVPVNIYDSNTSRNKGRWPSRSKEQIGMAKEALLAWRTKTYEKWVSSKRFRIGGETWFLPENVVKQLSQKFSRIRSAEAVAAIASSCHWTPLGGKKNIYFDEIAEVLVKLNNEIDASHVSPSSKLEDDSDSNGEGSDGEEDLLESEE
jgi:hypothetical protein